MASEMEFGPACSTRDGQVILDYLRTLVSRGKATNIEDALRKLAAAGPLAAWPKAPLILDGTAEARELLWWLDCAAEQRVVLSVADGLRRLAAGTAPSITLRSEGK